MTNGYPANFSREELLFSATAKRMGIKNTPSSEKIEENLIRLAWCLHDLRSALCEHFKKDMPIRVLSGYRNLKANRAVGGSDSSAHMLASAADITVEGMTPFELAEFCANNIANYDQIILEFDSWVHIGFYGKNDIRRMQKITAKKVKGKTVYLQGFKA